MINKKIFLLVSALIMINVLFSYSLSVYTVVYFGYGEFHFFIRAIIIGFICITIIWFVSRINADRHLYLLGFGLFGLFLFLMFIMHFLPRDFVTESGGASRWIRLPFFSLSPVEFFKVGFVFFLAWSFERKIPQKKIILIEELKVALPYFFVFLVLIILIAIMQNDFGQVFLLATTFGIMLLFAGLSFRFFSILSFVAFVMVFILIFMAEHRIDRILQWWANAQSFILSFFPNLLADVLRVDTLPEPYQMGHSLNAIYNGGFWGKFFGNGEFKYGFLTEVHTDFVLSGIAEEMGLFALSGICLIYASIIYYILKIANRVESMVYYLFLYRGGVIDRDCLYHQCLWYIRTYPYQRDSRSFFELWWKLDALFVDSHWYDFVHQ